MLDFLPTWFLLRQGIFKSQTNIFSLKSTGDVLISQFAKEGYWFYISIILDVYNFTIIQNFSYQPSCKLLPWYFALCNSAVSLTANSAVFDETFHIYSPVFKGEGFWFLFFPGYIFFVPKVIFFWAHSPPFFSIFHCFHLNFSHS